MTSVPFLKEIAGLLLKPGEYDLRTTCIVFPNKRARLYLSKYIGELTDKPVWAPQYLTITELMESISGYNLADRLSLVFELFESYCKITGSKESFDSFYPYSETLLADFDEIDKYLADADDLFQNLAGLKMLDGKFNYLNEEQVALIEKFWNTFSLDKISHDQSLFISLWESLAAIYHEFRSHLESRNLAYEGMAYRKAIQNISESIPGAFGYDKYLFVGFNALNKCEERLFNFLKNREQAEFFWDYDTWYTNNEIHEAGFFIRSNLRNFPQKQPLPVDNLRIEKEHILFIPVFSNSGQTSILPDIFEKLHIKVSSEIENTALVLADETLLMPALYSVPEHIKDINVTMGYPLSTSSVYSLIDSIYELSKNARFDATGNISWYFKDVLSILGNPVLKSFYGDTMETVRKKILSENLNYLEVKDIVAEGREEFIFTKRVFEDTCGFLLEIITDIIRNQSMESHSGNPDLVQTELLFQVYTYLTRLQDILSETNLVPGTDILFRLIRKMLRGMHIPFTGEPLTGLQVLGILETRTLDFENVILLSANEGILPRPSDKPSFIPYNLRAGFGLPTPDYHDAIYAYYFYRLIQRAKNVALVYDASTGGLRTGERSRFLHQLLYEMRLPVKELVIESIISAIPVKPIIIEKSEVIKASLMRYSGDNGKLLSPSAINEFLNCPLRFYFHHVAGLPQAEEVEEEIDARMFGTILHNTLKLIYEGFGLLPVTKEKLEDLFKKEETINQIIDKAFSEELFGENSGKNRKIEGYNLIVRQVIFAYVRQFIRAESTLCPFTIEDLENTYETLIPISVNGFGLKIKVGGIIDRIDKYEGKIRILDYKTGAIKNRFDNVESLFDAGDKLRNDAVFQVLLYAYVYNIHHPGETIVPGLYFLRQSYQPEFSHFILMGSKKEGLINFELVKEEFTGLLRESLERLFGEEPFLQTTNLRVCRYCPYALICRRDTNN
jgi:CRISPR/Cas system-associated exonuclease Cas4 (RecB family)